MKGEIAKENEEVIHINNESRKESCIVNNE